MREVKKKKVKKSILLRVAILCLVVYVAAALINQQIQIQQKRSQLEALQNQIQVQEVENEQLRQSIAATEKDGSEYAERVAREELDYAKARERVFIIISGE